MNFYSEHRRMELGVRRNQPCLCGSNKRYKECCGHWQHNPFIFNSNEILRDIEKSIESHKIKELIRQQQQGHGNPIISEEFKGWRFVAVGNILHRSNKWKTFHDFLMYYTMNIIGEKWGNNEISKPLNERHPILQWYNHVCLYQSEVIKEIGKVSSVPMTGYVEAYMHLSYSLYLLGHNTLKNEFNDKLQKRLIDRLKKLEEFPGAYYESHVFACLIRSGFEVEFEDEISNTSGCCDFIITHKKSGKKYTVEAKAIRREGTYGAKENTAKCSLKQSIRNQLYDSLKKPSIYPRIIFIELNLPREIERLQWLEEAVEAVNNAENITVSRKPTEPAFVILTNHSHQHHLNEKEIDRAGLCMGYKIPDFGHGKKFTRLRDMYYAKQRYNDIEEIMESIKNHYDIPVTFDGTFPSSKYYNEDRSIFIGERYLFEGVGESGLEATVISATVSEHEKIVYIGTDTGHILTYSLIDEELRDYKKHPDTYFGVQYKQGKNIEHPYKMFEFLLDTYSTTSKNELLSFMEKSSDYESLKLLSQKELAIIYSEKMANSFFKDVTEKAY